MKTFYVIHPQLGENVGDCYSFTTAKGLATRYNVRHIYYRTDGSEIGELYAVKKHNKWRVVDERPRTGIEHTMASIANARVEQLMSQSVPELEAQDKHARVVAMLAEMYTQEADAGNYHKNKDGVYSWLLDTLYDELIEKVLKP